ncbi:MAG: hypothetical protein JO300_11190 [Silvibacterium sp.]|nr:hypothetical protein [Silvibacterium sp.]
MKLIVEVDEREYILELQPDGAAAAYRLQGVSESSGTASVIEVEPGVYSVLLASRSFTVYLAPNGSGLEVWVGTVRRRISVADARDRSGKSKKAAAAGPLEIRAQMPGKVIKLLVAPGDAVEAGQGLIVVEAMKMQNEMKSPKEGVIRRIHSIEGATVAAGETLMVVE